MLQKFALAVKSKTIEFFAEDEEDDEEDNASIVSAAEEVITGQRVVVLKPDPPARPDPQTLAAAVFATMESFRSAYLNVQAAHAPLLPDVLRAADASAVSHLCRLSDLKKSFVEPSPKPHPISSLLRSQARENQTLLREFEAAVNRLQSDTDMVDAECTALRGRLSNLELENSQMQKKLDRATSPPEEKVESLLTLGVFTSVLKDACIATHRFSKIFIALMKKSNWDVGAAANSIYPGVVYVKRGHCRYAILSYVCLGMFGGFDRDGFCCKDDENGCGDNKDMDEIAYKRNSLNQFIEHSTLDAIELVSRSSSCDFSKFCFRKYNQLIKKAAEVSIVGRIDEGLCGLLFPSSPLYEHFISMASSIWMLHKLARAYDPAVEVFQVGRGMEFNAVYMESVIRRLAPDCMNLTRMKVAFTVIPGFRIGKTVIQCRVYLDDLKKAV